MEEGRWQDSWIDSNLRVDFGEDFEFPAITYSYFLPYSDPQCEDGLGTFDHTSYSSNRAASGNNWVDSPCINQEYSGTVDHYPSEESSLMEIDTDKERWGDSVLPEKLARSPICGLCVVGNLKRSTGNFRLGLYPAHDYLRWFQKAGPKPHGAWSRCSSTNTLVSRRKESLKGTGRWLLDHPQYIQWIDQQCAFLWLCGQPGAGKSVLMSTIIHDLDETRQAGDLVAYYFANGYYRGVSTTKAIICSMLGQFLFREPVRTSITEVLPLLNDLIAAGSMLSSSKMIWLLSSIRHMIRRDETLYLLLDGLDETTDSPQEKQLVLELIDFASRYDEAHQIKCLVSSRSKFFGDRLPNGALRVDMGSHGLSRRDMSLYVQDTLQKSVIAYPSRDNHELAERLLNSASGSFLVLRLILEANRPTSGNTDSDYKDFVVSLNDVSDFELTAIYGRLLAGIEDRNKEAALSMLRWVTFSARPLELHELRALYQQTGIEIKEEDISAISAGLLVSCESRIQFTHLSVREYLETQLRDRWDELSEEAHEMIAHACLKILTGEDLLQSLSLSTGDTPPANETPVSEFIPYARAHWIFHYQRGERRSTYLAGMLHDVLEHGLITSKKDGRTRETHTGKTTGKEPKNVVSVEYQGHSFHGANLVDIALGVGARFGFTKLSAMELDMGADANFSYGPEQQTPLCLAAQGGHLDVVKLLLQRGADPNISTRSGTSPIGYAMIHGHSGIQDTLIQYASQKTERSDLEQQLGISCGAAQEYLLTTLISSNCKSCEVSRVQYELQAVPPIMEEGKVLPPIMVSGEAVSASELALYISRPYTRKSRTHSSINVRWYHGAHMYQFLSSISKRGMEDVRRVLLAAGNDEDSLDMVLSVSKLLSRSRI